jgi:hypothetical protein
MRGLVTAALCCGVGNAASAYDNPDLLKAMDLSSGVIQNIDIAGGLGGPVDFQFFYGDQFHTVAMDPFSIRAPGYRLLVDDGQQIVEVDPGPERTYRGFIDTLPGAVVSASLLESGLHAMMIVPDDVGSYQMWTIQPARSADPEAPRDLYVVFSGVDVITPEGMCGVDLFEAPPVLEPAQGGQADGAGHVHAADGGCCPGHDEVESDAPASVPSTREPFIYQALLALDADFEYYQLNGSNVTTTQNDMANVINNVNIAYERDVEIRHMIGTVIVRTSSSQPYTSTNSGTRLNQVRNHWQSAQSGVPRDLVHLFTGVTMNNGVLGIAYLSGVCSFQNQYAVSRARFSTNLNNRIALVAHELGHNWSAQHCNSSGNSNCNIMCSGLGGCGGFGNPPSFRTPAINQIINHRNSRTCLDIIDLNPVLIDPPFEEGWEFGFVFEDLWPVFTATLLIPPGATAPSAPFAVEFTGFQEIQTAPVNLANVGGPVDVAFQLRGDGLQGIDQIVVELANGTGGWILVDSFRLIDLANGGADWKLVVANLPAAQLVNSRRVRIRSVMFTAGAKFYVDDVYIGPELDIKEPPVLACNPADLNTASASSPVAMDWGVPDGILTPTDFSAFVNFFSTGDLRADINNASASSTASPLFGIPDGILSATDFTAFVAYFNAGCPCTLPGCP